MHEIPWWLWLLNIFGWSALSYQLGRRKELLIRLQKIDDEIRALRKR